MIGAARVIAIDVALAVLAAGCGTVGAWWLRRSTTLSIRNLYPPAAVLVAATVLAIGTHQWIVAAVLLPFGAGCGAAVAAGRRWRLNDLVPARSCGPTSSHAGGSGNPRPTRPPESGCD